MSSPALVAAFAARLDRVLEHLRSELRTGDALVYRMFGGYYFAELAPPVSEDAIWQSPTFSGRKAEGLAPVPLTVAEAIATVTADRDALAAAFAAELADCAAVLLPAEHRAGALADPAVIAAWPVRTARSVGPSVGPAEALSHLLERVPNLPGEATPERTGIPAVTAWARPLTGGAYIPVAGGYFPSAGINALYRYLWAHSPLFAASQAGCLVRELTSVIDPGPAYMTAVRDALGSYAHPDEGAPDDLALAALEDTQEAQSRLSVCAVGLLHKARNVARIFAADPVDDDDARKSAETRYGPALHWDVAFAAMLAERGETVRENAAERWTRMYGPQERIPGSQSPLPGSLWSLWEMPSEGAPRWLRVLARDLWLVEWKPGAEEDRERARRQRMYSGVPGVLTLAANRALTRTFDVARTGELQGEQLVLFAPGWPGEVARIELARVDIRIHARIVALLAEAPPAVDALFTFALHQGFQRWREMPRDGYGDGEILIEGGKRGLAAILQCGDKDTDYALTWGQRLTLPDIDVKGLWTWNGTYQSAAPGRPARGLLTIQRALLPGAEHEVTGKGRYFAPWTEGPPLPADRSQRRAALHFWRLLGVRMAEIAADGRLIGGRAVLPLAVVEHAAKQAGEDRWQARRDEWIAAGALDVDGDGWRYGPMYAAESKLLEGNQELQRKAAKGGRARAANAERARDGVFSSRRKRSK